MYITLTSKTAQQSLNTALSTSGKAYFTEHNQGFYAKVVTVNFPNIPGQIIYHNGMATAKAIKDADKQILGVCPQGAAVARIPHNDFDKSGKITFVYSDKVKVIPDSLLKDAQNWKKYNV